MKEVKNLDQSLLDLLIFYSVLAKCPIAWRFQKSGKYTLCFISAYSRSTTQMNFFLSQHLILMLWISAFTFISRPFLVKNG